MSPFMVRTSFTLTQQAYPLGIWAAKHGYKKAFVAQSPTTRPATKAPAPSPRPSRQAGGEVVGQVKFPPPPTTPDFAPYLQKVKDAKPDVLYIFVPAGAQATSVMKAARDLDLKGAGVAIISTEDLVPDEELPNIGDQAIGARHLGHLYRRRDAAGRTRNSSPPITRNTAPSWRPTSRRPMPGTA